MVTAAAKAMGKPAAVTPTPARAGGLVRPAADLEGAAVPEAKRQRSAGSAGEVKPWTARGSVHIRDYASPASAKVAAFDMDDTLIKTKSGKTFAVSKDDWAFWSDKVVAKLAALHAEGHKVVVISNQAGVTKGKASLGDLQAKVDAVQKQCGIPMLVMLLTEDDEYRKPLPASWRLMEAEFNGGVATKSRESFYCGDAAGREPPIVKKKDHSAGDLHFALNLGVKFLTPEECFAGEKQKYEREKLAFDPRTLGQSPAKFPVPALKAQTLVICVGPPGCGKSSLATSVLQDCARVNQDTLRTKEKCAKACEAALKAGRSVVVDNQNRGKSDRAAYLKLAKAAGVPAIAVYYDVPKELCFHLNAYRHLHKGSALHRADKVPSMVIHAFYKNVEVPAEAEGFQNVYRVGLEHFTIVNKEDADLGLLRSFLS